MSRSHTPATLANRAHAAALLDEFLATHEGKVRAAEVAAATQRKVLLTVPADLQDILGIGRSSAFALMNRPGFPPVARVGASRYLTSAALFAWLADLASKGELAATLGATRQEG